MGQKSKMIRVLLTKSILDHHDRGIKYLSQFLRNAEMEVIYTEYGLPEEIVNMAVQEAVDAIGISFLSGGQVKVTQRVVELLKEQGLGEIPIFVGGTIRPFDTPKLEELGVKGIYRGGDPLDGFVDKIREYCG